MRARLVVKSGECSPPVLELTSGQTATIGRSRENLLVVPNDLVSRLHAKVYCEGGTWYVRDFGLNGTRVEGERISGAVPLADGQTIQLGDVQLRFLTISQPLTPTPAPSHPLSQLRTDTTPPPGVLRKAGSGVMSQEIIGTKAIDYPSRELPSKKPESTDPGDTQLKVDELTTLCRFMSEAVATQDPQDLISRTLRIILNQTSATLAGYLSLDPNDTMPKVVLPERAAVDMRLSRRLTEQVRHTRKKAWLFADEHLSSPGDSLQKVTDAVCLPLAGRLAPQAELNEPFAALHVYRTGRGFQDREVRFLELVAGFLSQTLEIQRTRRKLEAENHRLRTAAPLAEELIGDSSAIMNLRMQIGRAAPQPFTVLIQGESGSGKELVAFALHQHSPRASGPLVIVNCAAIAPTQLELELFGCRKGAMNGLDRDYAGLFEQADEGTLVLDEVGELSLDCQAKLLRVIEGKAFRPLGGTRDLKVDVRLVAATNRDLDAEVRAGRFRQDLYFRLKVIHLRVPPLREHCEDIPELARFFLERLSTQCRRSFRLTSAAVDRLMNYNWPGNVRQLRAMLESAAVMAEHDVIDADQLPIGGGESTPLPASQSLEIPASLDIDDLETWAIRRALIQTVGNVSQAARLLGMSRDTLHTKLKKKGIDRETLLNEHL